MKKSTILFLIFLTIAIAGCSFFSQKEEIPAPTEQDEVIEKRTGIVTEAVAQSSSTENKIFMLQTDNGESVSLISISVNLSRYKGRRVEVEGIYDADTKTLEVQTLTSLGQETLVKKEYQDTELGVRFNYPSVWNLTVEKNVSGAQRIVVTPYEVSPEEGALVDRIVIERTGNNRKLTPQQWLFLDDFYRPQAPTDSTVYQQSTIGVSQLPAVKATKGADTVEFYVQRDTAMYILSHTTVSDADKDLYRNTFYDIVGSFEFVAFSPKATNSSPSEKDAGSPSVEKSKLVSPSPSVSNTMSLFATYIQDHIDEKAPVESTGFRVTQIEFAYPEGGSADEFSEMYVTYTDGIMVRRTLFSVDGTRNVTSLTVAADFIPGITTDWQLVTGTDIAKTLEKYVLKTSTSTGVAVKKGMQLIESKSFKINFQIPANYYWAFSNGRYVFSTKANTIGGSDVDGILVKDPGLDWWPDGRAPQSRSERDGVAFEEVWQADRLYICVQKKSRYCTLGYLEFEQTAKNILFSIIEL